MLPEVYDSREQVFLRNSESKILLKNKTPLNEQQLIASASYFLLAEDIPQACACPPSSLHHLICVFFPRIAKSQVEGDS
jgi:hypothetical protein